MIHTMLNLKNTMWALMLIVGAAGLAVADPPAPVAPEEEISQVPPLPATPAPVRRLLHAQPFKLDKGYEFEWRADRPMVSSGWMLVLQVEPALVFPRQVAEPLLLVGKTTAERINVGHQSGRIVVIVPSPLDEQSNPELKLEEAMMWFGTPTLPEQVDAGQIEAERIAATNAGIRPFDARSIQTARQGRKMIVAGNREQLRNVAADLVELHSPQEFELIQSLRADAAPQAGKVQ